LSGRPSRRLRKRFTSPTSFPEAPPVAEVTQKQSRAC
jgi:hypothetical protein